MGCVKGAEICDTKEAVNHVASVEWWDKGKVKGDESREKRAKVCMVFERSLLDTDLPFHSERQGNQ